MRKLKEMLRLHLELGLGCREIGRSLSCSHTTVAELLRRAEAAALTWPLPDEVDEGALAALLYPGNLGRPRKRPEPDYEYIHRELRRKRCKGVTLQLLWVEYKEAYPHGLQYSQFCLYYRRWEKTIDVVMRQEHKAGEKLFVDYAGQKVPVVERSTGEIREAHIFVATLGASNYGYCEASFREDLPAFLLGCRHALEAIEGVPRLLIPDNLKSGVTGPCRYEPDTNPTFQDFARHYGLAVLPTRPYRARDKAKVEVGVQVVERLILAPLRNRTFFSLAELNEALRMEMARVNERPFQKLAGCRRDLYLALDRPALSPLPARPFEFALWKKAKVNIDYHVQVEKCFYSVPYTLAREVVDVRLTASTVEILHRGERVASHQRLLGQGRFTTTPEHMPDSHRRHREWSPSRLIAWGETVGPNTASLVAEILRSRPHPEHGYRSCLGLMRLGRHYSPARLEAAAGRALALGALSYRSVDSILKKGLDRLPQDAPAPERLPLTHENLRGPDYFKDEERNPC